jgi:hypothetical protein
MRFSCAVGAMRVPNNTIFLQFAARYRWYLSRQLYKQNFVLKKKLRARVAMHQKCDILQIRNLTITI